MSYYKVSYDKLFPYAAFLNERIGIEILVEHNQDPLEALEEARKVVHDFRNKHIQAELSHQYEPTTEIQVEKSTKRSLEEIIMECTELEGENGLYSYRKIAEMNPKLKEAYDLTLKYLSK